MLLAKIVWRIRVLYCFSKFEQEALALRTALLKQYTHNCSLRTQTETLEDFVCQKLKVFYFFLEFRRKNSWNEWKNLAVFSKLRYTCFEAFLLVFYPIFCRLWSYQILNEIILVWLAKLFCSGPEFCRSRNVSLKKNNFVTFCGLWAKDFDHRTKFFSAVFPIFHCTCPGQNFRWKFFLEIFFPLFLWLWVTKSKTLS